MHGRAAERGLAQTRKLVQRPGVEVRSRFVQQRRSKIER